MKAGTTRLRPPCWPMFGHVPKEDLSLPTSIHFYPYSFSAVFWSICLSMFQQAHDSRSLFEDPTKAYKRVETTLQPSWTKIVHRAFKFVTWTCITPLWRSHHRLSIFTKHRKSQYKCTFGFSRFQEILTKHLPWTSFPYRSIRSVWPNISRVLYEPFVWSVWSRGPFSPLLGTHVGSCWRRPKFGPWYTWTSCSHKLFRSFYWRSWNAT